MDEQIVLKISKEFGHNEFKQKVFKNFIALRFPLESHESYIREWAGRFNKVPSNYMDAESLKAYNEALAMNGYGGALKR